MILLQTENITSLQFFILLFTCNSIDGSSGIVLFSKIVNNLFIYKDLSKALSQILNYKIKLLSFYFLRQKDFP